MFFGFRVFRVFWWEGFGFCLLFLLFLGLGGFRDFGV